MKKFDLVRFAHERDGGPVHRVVSVMHDGMIELHDIGGYFAPNLFVIADDVAGIPPREDPVRDGGPAFPCSVQPDFQYAEAGMSLRDWFAGQALAGWLASFGETTSPKADKCAAFAYEMADAMLAERAEAENANG